MANADSELQRKEPFVIVRVTRSGKKDDRGLGGTSGDTEKAQIESKEAQEGRSVETPKR